MKCKICGKVVTGKHITNSKGEIFCSVKCHWEDTHKGG